MSKGAILMIVGGALVLAGLVMAFIQLLMTAPAFMHQSRSLDIGPKGVSLKTTYVGLAVLLIGAAMMVAGAVIGD